MSRAHLIYGNKTNGNNYEDTYYNWSKHQQLMPRLPVPSLNDTIEGYLSSVKHLLSTEEYEVTKNVANDFLLNEGKNLHEELLERNRRNSAVIYLPPPPITPCCCTFRLRLPLIAGSMPGLYRIDDTR